jgi:hypothetical protein
MAEPNGHAGTPNGHAADAAPDPFGELFTRRVKPVPLTFEFEDADGNTITRTFDFEIREATYAEAKPLLAQAATMEPTEFGQRLIGLAVYLNGQQLTFERVLKMTPATIGKLMELVPTVVEIYRLAAPDDENEEKPATAGSDGVDDPAKIVDDAPAAAVPVSPPIEDGGGTLEKKD